MKLAARLTSVAAAIVVAVAGAVTIAPSPASALLSDCPNGRFCIFENASGAGHYAYFQVQARDLSDPDFLNGYMNDKTSAVYNRTGVAWCLYEHAGFSGRSLVIDAVTTYKSLAITVGGFNWNDKVSSVAKYRWIDTPVGGRYGC